MADVALLASTVQDAGGGYTVPGAQEIILKCCTASYDGAGAGGNFLPALQIIAPNGAVMGTFPTSTTVTAGNSADVSWFPRLGSGGGGGAGIAVTDGSTVVNPATELFIGALLKLTNPTTGEAKIALEAGQQATPLTCNQIVSLLQAFGFSA
jgi:hypothetical protein